MDFLDHALAIEDQKLIQKYVGQCLLGINLTQTFLLIYGTTGGGKSTFLNIIENLVGQSNCAQLRTKQLDHQFELTRFIGKTLLTGKDVQKDFLNLKSASSIKSLTGGDLLSAEKKYVSDAINIKGEFNLIVSSNDRLRVNLESDRDAWKRRLLIVNFNRPCTSKPIPNFDQVLMTEEGEGILAWAVEGAKMLLVEIAEKGRIVLSDSQADLVDELIDESDSLAGFVRTQIEKTDVYPDYLPTSLIITRYNQYCLEKDWCPKTEVQVGHELPALMAKHYGVSRRNDIETHTGTVRGYKSVRFKPFC